MGPAILDLVLLVFLYHVASLGSLSAAPAFLATRAAVLLSEGCCRRAARAAVLLVAAGWNEPLHRFYVTAALQAAGGAALLSQGTRAGAALLCAVSVGVWPSPPAHARGAPCCHRHRSSGRARMTRHPGARRRSLSRATAADDCEMLQGRGGV